MRESQNRVTYQASTTWCLKKGTQRKRIPGNQPQRSSTLGSSSACSIRTILTSRQRPLLQSISHHQWLGQQSSPPSLPSRNEDDQRNDVLQSGSSEATRKASESVWFSKARSRQVAGDLFSWRGERRGTCIWWCSHLQFDSKTKQHLIPTKFLLSINLRFFLPCP